MSADLPRLAGSALVALFLWLAPFCAAAADITFEKAPLQIISTNGKVHKFTVELAVDSDQRSHGLMNRRHMPRDRGMLFDFGETRQVMMWMKNTYLPLDMLFIARDGRIETIRENAVPLSEAIIDSRIPVAFVLELNGGTVNRLGIATGDIVDSPRISGLKP
ncbi:DUF192 domain-containing protein [Pararhizobium sp. YC-54]|uniref:DUF192 domain-containing protein n=1 Tax=Pararhizobium sp. YC-54 TaxID=2986920 RepID=UPI0021F760EA|nr:DUF192 domain-containing protein [Pararhizobium sp. YC-54]MCV9997106.1 DUF192 domain-containing protein [Pararhizobium sp. YC-54]